MNTTLTKLKTDYVTSRMSDYLTNGWKSEYFELIEISHCEAEEFEIVLFAREYAPDHSGEFHFSALQLFRWVQQMAIAWICLDLGVTKSQLGEVFLTRFDVKCRNVITNRTIRLKMLQPKKGTKFGKIFYEGQFDCEDSLFTGRISACVDAPTNSDGWEAKYEN